MLILPRATYGLSISLSTLWGSSPRRSTPRKTKKAPLPWQGEQLLAGIPSFTLAAHSPTQDNAGASC